MQTTMAQALPQSTARKNVRVVPVEPNVKSAKTCKLFNASVSGKLETAKTTDPSCYNAVTVELRTGMFDIVEMKMKHVYNDGGRAAAGFKGKTGDCCVRAFSIATGRSYQEVYDLVNDLAGKERRGSRKRGMSSARTGVHKATAHKLAYELNNRVRWVPCMSIGSGAKVHMREDELPKGNIVVSLSKHYAAVVDGVLHDTFEDNRGGTRCVYGYWDFSNLR